MTDIVGARALVRARLEEAGSGITVALRFQGDRTALPDVPAPFAYVVFNNEGSGGRPAAFGGGRGNNLYRNRAFLEAFVFSPIEEGQEIVDAHAETIAARLRAWRSGDVSCFAADVIPVGEGATVAPAGLSTEVSNYQCAIVEATMTFDQIG